MKVFKQVKHYGMIGQGGKGATGIVYQAIDNRTNKLVAIKTIDTKKGADPRIANNIKRELNLLHSFKNNNIIKTLGAEKTEHNWYIALEYCNGGNLSDGKRYYESTHKKQMNEFLVQKILKQLISGGRYMHDCGTIHRDLKGDNIGINFDKISNIVLPGQVPPKVNYAKVSLQDPFTIKIADGGYARELENDVASTVCGTPITMAPDVFQLTDPKGNNLSYNNKADLWSLGAITYELLIGKSPFYAHTYQQLFEQVKQGTYTLPKSLKLSIECLTFINGLLQFYPEKRFDWSQIAEHPFITKSVDQFDYIDLTSINQTDVNDPKNLEVNSKNADNYLWLNFKNHAIKDLSKVNNEEVKKPLGKDIILKQSTINTDIMKEVEEEKKRLKEEKEKLEKEREELSKIKEENEKLAKEGQNDKKKIENEQELNKKKDDDKKKEIKKAQKELELEKERVKKKEKEAEKLMKNAKKIKDDTEKQKKELEEQNEKDKGEKERMEELRKKDEQKYKEELEGKEKKQKEMEEVLKKQLKQVTGEKEKGVNEVEEKKLLENELKKKQNEKDDLEKKIEAITNEKDKKIMEIEKEKKEKELELLQEKKKREDEELLRKENELREQEEKIKLNMINNENQLKNLQINAEETVTKGNEEKEEDDWEYIPLNPIEYESSESFQFEVIDHFTVPENEE